MISVRLMSMPLARNSGKLAPLTGYFQSDFTASCCTQGLCFDWLATVNSGFQA